MGTNVLSPSSANLTFAHYRDLLSTRRTSLFFREIAFDNAEDPTLNEEPPTVRAVRVLIAVAWDDALKANQSSRLKRHRWEDPLPRL